MKSPRLFPYLIGCVAIALATASAKPVLVRVTPETIARLQQRDPLVRLEKPTDESQRIVRPRHTSVVKESTILHDGTHWTLVPNGAVIHLPEAQRERINARPVGKLMPWPEFLARNSAWLTTREVSFDLAAGNEKIDPAVLNEWKSGDKIVIAVHQQGPIRVKLGVANPELTSR